MRPKKDLGTVSGDREEMPHRDTLLNSQTLSLAVLVSGFETARLIVRSV